MALKLSILIPTVPEREKMLSELLSDLNRQVAAEKAEESVEFIVHRGPGSVGVKRNRLLDEALGEYVVFIDDDDQVSEDYLFQVLHGIEAGCDMVGFRALMSVSGGSPRQVIYSCQNDSQVQVGSTYFRLPCHLTPIRRSLLSGVRFSEKNLGEDSDFSSTLYREKRIRKEFFVDKVLYHYRFDPASSLTQKGRTPGAPQGRDLNRFDIVILSQQPDNLRGCLDSIFLNEPALLRDRVIVVDDGSREYCEKEYPGITWLEGKKPFIFARNANIGIGRAPMGVILLNDDARLESRFGFSSLVYASLDRPDLGVVSSSIRGFVGNENQKTFSRVPRFRMEHEKAVAFISVFLPKGVIERVGTLDERFVAYGHEDNDLVRRIRMAGLGVGIYDGCVVEHNSKENKSTYRTKAEIGMLLAQNRKIYEEKWKDK